MTSAPISILVVDDQPSNVVAVEAALEGIDCNLVKARSGRDALRSVLVHDFAVIVLDIHMPGLDGFETARLIRARQKSQATPIVFLAADDRTGERVQEGYRLGAVDYIYKPFAPNVLRAKVAVFVELCRKTAALEQRTAELTRVTARLVEQEQQVRALNVELQARVNDRTVALEHAVALRGQAEAALTVRDREHVAARRLTTPHLGTVPWTARELPETVRCFTSTAQPLVAARQHASAHDGTTTTTTTTLGERGR